MGGVTVYHGTRAERVPDIMSRGFVDSTYHFAGSGTAVAGTQDGVFVAPSVEKAREYGEVVIAFDIDATASVLHEFDRFGEALIPAAALNCRPRRIEEAVVVRIVPAETS